MKNQKNNIFAFVILGLLFLWSVNLSNKEQAAAKEKQKLAQELVDDKIDTVDKETVVPPVTKLITSSNTLLEKKEDKDSMIVSDSMSQIVDSNALVQEKIFETKTVVETEHFIVEFENKGAKISSLVLKELENEKGEFPQLLEYPEKGILDFSLDNVDFSSSLFSVNVKEDTILVEKDFDLIFTWKGDGGVVLTRKYSFSKTSSVIKHDLQVVNYQAKEYELKLNAGLKETEKAKGGGFGLANYDFSEVVFRQGEFVKRNIITNQTIYEKDEDGKIEWVGLRRKYLAALIDFNRETDLKLIADEVKSVDERVKPTYSLIIEEEMPRNGLQFDFILLPLEYNNVKALGRNYEKLIWDGWNFLWANKWFTALCGMILSLLNWLHSVLGNYGVGIIVLTLLVKFITLPLMISQTRAMKKMAQHKPALDALRKQHAGDPRKYQEEMMKYYKEKGINPMASMLGCLPMFIQMPVFFSLFIVFSRTLELRNAPFFGWITDLSSPDILTTALSIPFIMPEGLSLLPFIMAVTTYYQTKQSMTDPNMQGMVYIMPLMMFGFSGVMPSGLVLYWIVSNLFTIIQYSLIGAPSARAAAVK